MKAYVDSSVLLRNLLGEKEAVNLENVTWAVTCQITSLECLRTLDRLHLRSLLPTEEFAEVRNLCLKSMSQFEIIQTTEGLLSLAESSFGVPIGSLDSLHLVSAILWQRKNNERLEFLTHDRELALAATSQGFNVRG